MKDVPEPQLSAEERRAFEKGVAEFNSGCFFECHDTLEDLWSGLRGPARDFFQGLIQVAVAFHHWSGGNRAGAESLFTRALGRFERYPGHYFGFDLERHRAEIASWLERVRAGEGVDPPKWEFGSD